MEETTGLEKQTCWYHLIQSLSTDCYEKKKNNPLWLNIKTLRTNALVYHIRHTHILTLMCFLLYHVYLSVDLWQKLRDKNNFDLQIENEL